jgi:hypothetical protein
MSIMERIDSVHVARASPFRAAQLQKLSQTANLKPTELFAIAPHQLGLSTYAYSFANEAHVTYIEDLKLHYHELPFGISLTL